MEICSHCLANSPTAGWGPTTRSSPAASFIHRLWKLKSWPAARNLNPSWPAARHGKAPAVQESLTEAKVAKCHGSCRYIRVKKWPRAETFFTGAKADFSLLYVYTMWHLPTLTLISPICYFQRASCPLPSSSVLQGVAIFIFIYWFGDNGNIEQCMFCQKWQFSLPKTFLEQSIAKLIFYRFDIATWGLDCLSSLVSTLVIKSVGNSFEYAYLRGLWAFS